MATRVAKPRCNRADCFQNKLGVVCDLLMEHAGNPCPFYKTIPEAEVGKIEAHRRLVDLGRFDLIEKYEHNKYRKGQW